MTIAHRIARVAVLTLLAACGPTGSPNCITPCGVHVYGTDEAKCASLYEHEGRTLKSFEKYVEGWKYDETCPIMRNWSLRVLSPEEAPGGVWRAANGQMVAGITWCGLGYIEIGTDDWRNSAFSHEYAHAVESCWDHEHTTWGDRKINRAIEHARGWYEEPPKYP